MREILNSHSVSNLKKEISKTNIKGYSKMKKADIVNLMMKHKQRFSHIKHSGGKAKAEPKAKAPKKEYKSKEFVGKEDNVPDKKKKAPKKAEPVADKPKTKRLIKKKKLKIRGQDDKVSNFLGDIEQKGSQVARMAMSNQHGNYKSSVRADNLDGSLEAKGLGVMAEHFRRMDKYEKETHPAIVEVSNWGYLGQTADGESGPYISYRQSHLFSPLQRKLTGLPKELSPKEKANVQWDHDNHNAYDTYWN